MLKRSPGPALLLVACALALACGPAEGPLVCGEIPEEGCPVGRGGTCDDLLCDALYDCVEGDWTLTETCSQAGGGAAEGGAAQGGAAGEGGCMPPVIDHTGEADGCRPDLLFPDCPVEAAEVCGPCSTGCIDFFLCKERGWTALAFCTDVGELVLEQSPRP